MDTDTIASHELLRQCHEVACFTLALHRVACMYEWREVEPYAEQAWYQISESRGPMWAEIRDFVREAWID